MTIEPTRRSYVQSVDRALDLIELLWTSPGTVSNSELAAETGLAPPTIHRLLTTLERRDWVRRDGSDRSRYGVGLRLLGLAGEWVPQVSRLIQPHLELATVKTGETANAAVLEGVWGVYVAQSEGSHAVRMFTRIGNRVHLHRTGVGKVLLAHGPPDLVDQVTETLGLPPSTSRSIVDRARLEAELEEIRERGFAVDNEEEEEGVSCVAVPVGLGLRHHGLALSVSGPSGRILPQTEFLSQTLWEIARRAELSLAPRLPDGSDAEPGPLTPTETPPNGAASA